MKKEGRQSVLKYRWKAVEGWQCMYRAGPKHRVGVMAMSYNFLGRALATLVYTLMKYTLNCLLKI